MNILLDIPVGGCWSMGIVGEYILKATEHYIPDNMYLALWNESDSYYKSKYRLYNVWPKGDFIHFRYSHPNSCEHMKAKLNVGYFMVEYTKLPDGWAKVCKEIIDLIFVPSVFCQKVFADHGIETSLMPVGIDTDLFPHKTRNRNSGNFVFLTLADQQERKGIGQLVRCFRKAFGNKHTLIIKNIGSYNSCVQYQRQNITVINNKMPYNELINLYHNADGFVFPTRAEGFGLPILEALLSGLPVVTTDFSGQVDFCDPTEVIMIPSKTIIDAPEGKGIWKEPTDEDLIDAMRKMINNYKQPSIEYVSNLRQKYHYLNTYMPLINLSHGDSNLHNHI